ncbi:MULTISPECIES: hypothetical protein [Neorhizobium]|jgi:hypothetical protein|uniref:hypothetical protein n=1 Tax=Neorhizobium sp. T6_25 TaxID=2093833 RepID=UPI000CF9C56E|nr:MULTISPECIES: hypothetical protein [Neorhizobium]
MQILKLDPRALKDNPDNSRRSTSSPQADALLLATVKAVGIIQLEIFSAHPCDPCPAGIALTPGSAVETASLLFLLAWKDRT